MMSSVDDDGVVKRQTFECSFEMTSLNLVIAALRLQFRFNHFERYIEMTSSEFINIFHRHSDEAVEKNHLKVYISFEFLTSA